MLTSALPGTSTNRLGKRESVALLAALMALTAIGIDAMVPALPAIGESLRVATENQRQLVIIVYMLGFGVGQLFWGPISDRFGRKPVLVVGIAFYVVVTIGCAAAPTFAWLLAGRAAMGAAAASTRVLVTAIVRDLFEGEAMARIMSLVFMIFMVMPVIAPSMGQAIMSFAPWRAIFWAMAGYALLLLAWGWLRLPETLHPEYRRSLDPGVIVQGVRAVLGDRLAVGYTLATTALAGSLSAYIATIQQIIADVFHQPDQIPLVFAAVAAPMAVAAWGNSAIVGRIGLRRVGRAGVIAFLVVALTHLGLALAGVENLWLFIALQGLSMMSFALCTSNFSTLAMKNMGAIAGTASSVQGVSVTIGGALIGLVIGQAFDGTVVPFLIGLALCGLVALILVSITERGKLMGPIDVSEVDPMMASMSH